MSFATTMVVEATAVIGINLEFVAIRVSTDVDIVEFHLDEFMSLATIVEI